MEMNETVKQAQKLLIDLIRANRITFLIKQPESRVDKQLFINGLDINENEGKEDLQLSLGEEPLTKRDLETVLSIRL